MQGPAHDMSDLEDLHIALHSMHQADEARAITLYLDGDV